MRGATFVSMLFLATVGSYPAFGREQGYAVWHGHSSISPGTIVAVGDGDFVDYAILRPEQVFRTKEPIVDQDKKRVILPMNAMLVKMSGGREGEFCTWNHGKEFLPQRFRSRITLGGLSAIGAILCVKIDSQNRTTNLHYSSGDNALLLREYRLNFARGAKHSNSVDVEIVSPESYYDDAQVGSVLLVRRLSKNETEICLEMKAGVVGNKPDLTIPTTLRCFEGAGSSVQIGDAKYTLVQSSDSRHKIRIDKSFEVFDFAPRVFVRWNVQFY